MGFDNVSGIMEDINESIPMATQLAHLMQRYHERTGRTANGVCVHPDTLAKHPVSNCGLALSIRSYYMTPKYILWVGEVS